MSLRFQVRWQVGRIHVGSTILQVARVFYRDCGLWQLPRAARKYALREAFIAHRENQALCAEFRI